MSAIASEWRNGWPVLATGVVGNLVAINSCLYFSLSSFMQPLQNEFGWSRAEIGFVLTSITLMTAVTSPFVGRVCDRWGARAVILVSIPLAAASLAALSRFDGALWMLYLAYAAVTVAGAGTLGLAYVGPIARRFDRRRGIALGISFAGAGVAAVIFPLWLRPVIAAYGWRTGMLGIGMLTLGQWPIAYLLLRDDRISAPSRTVPRWSITTIAKVLRSPAFWLMCLPFFLVAMTVAGLIANLLALLADRGLAPSAAAVIASLVGIGIIAARLIAGWLMDRFWAPSVAACVFAAAGLGCIGLFSALPLVVGVCSLLLGFTVGAEMDLLAYMSSRYFGAAQQGAVFGAALAVFNAGAVLAPLVIGGLYALTHDYAGSLVASFLACLAASIVVLRLGPYPRRAVGVA